MPTPRHRALRPRPVLASLVLVLLASLVLTLSSPGGPPAASAASEVPKSTCKRFDPNLVNGMCLRYQARSGTGYTWIGSYRADNGKVFFCIDYLYDSRIVSDAAVVDTDPLENQLGRTIGNAEVAALNYLISTWAPSGLTGSNRTDAAIALIIREVMSDATRSDGTVVYPPGLKVGDTVHAPTGGLPGSMLTEARSLWDKASKYYGPSRLVLAGAPAGGRIELGESHEYRVGVRSATERYIPGLTVSFSCTGPITCPRPVTTGLYSVGVVVTPRAPGRVSIRATAVAPSADGKLLRLSGWRTHSGPAARDNGVQRGWIGQRNSTAAEATVAAEVVKGTPTVTTRTSTPTAVPGTALTDLVTVSGLPIGSAQQVTASLFGPFQERPRADSCTDAMRVDQVGFSVAANGTFVTPPVTVHDPGYYVWTESMPGDEVTNPVTTPCGIAEETTVVVQPKVRAPRAPTVRTVASARHLLVGRPVSDEVLVSGLQKGVTVEVGWSLVGPVAPRSGSCSGLDWSGAPTVARGSFPARADGTYRTPKVRLRTPGCFTFTERLAATDATAAVSTSPGEASETVLVTRPVVPVVPEIATGPARSGRR